VELRLGHQQGRFNVYVEEFRELGVQHKLLFITDVRMLLRAEERKAWKNLVRVISHEINNSLSPIVSIGQTLTRLINRQDDAINNRKDLIDGLTIVTERADGLRHFVESYKHLAKLPEPTKKKTSVFKLVEKTCILFKNQQIEFESNPDFHLYLDPVQFEQVLINILKNAHEAMVQAPHGIIRIEWYANEHTFTFKVFDQGCGLGSTDNLFIPFYSTKKNGSGIGLVLCRQIVEAHNGRLSIANQIDSPGCCVIIEIPHAT
jgi:nitrogen fixation/metabolism regulation signal transduction histidine kinase